MLIKEKTMYQIRQQPRNVTRICYKLYHNQSGLKIDLIDMNDVRVCKHLQCLKVVRKIIVAVSEDEN